MTEPASNETAWLDQQVTVRVDGVTVQGVVIREAIGAWHDLLDIRLTNGDVVTKPSTWVEVVEEES